MQLQVLVRSVVSFDGAGYYSCTYLLGGTRAWEEASVSRSLVSGTPCLGKCLGLCVTLLVCRVLERSLYKAG
jgi:hypothetical protein